MADAKVQEAEDSAETANAAASEAVIAEPHAQVAAQPAPEAEPAPVEFPGVEFPAKAQRARQSPSAAEPVDDSAAPAAEVAPRKLAGKPRPLVKAKAKPAKMSKVATSVRKPVAPKPAAAPKPAPNPVKITVTNIKKTSTVSQLPTVSKSKDKIMATTKNPDFTNGFQDAVAQMQSKAKTAFEKSTSSIGDIGEFAKGNVEALVESGKILAAGVQELSSSAVTESRTAFETLSADVKELTSAKTPVDFFKLQSELLRRNFDAAVATGSKNSEAMLKLVNEAFAPISGRVSLAIDKAKAAA